MQLTHVLQLLHFFYVLVAVLIFQNYNTMIILFIALSLVILLICVFVITAFTSIKKETQDDNLGIEMQSLVKKQTGELQNIKQLFTAKRFDLPMKYIYANFRERNVNSDFGLRLYKEHLRVWNGFKERNQPKKNTFEKFKTTFDTILDSVKSDGFDGNKSKIVIDSDNNLLNGAHRTVSCALYNKEAKFRIGTSTDGQVNCDYKMFQTKKLDSKFLDAAALQLCRMNKNSFVVCLFPAAKGKDAAVEKILTEYGEIAYKKYVYLNSTGAHNLMRQAYLDTLDLKKWISEKVRRCFTNDDLLRVYLVQIDNQELAKQCKRQIRDIYKLGQSLKRKNSVHINDTHEEALILARALFNDNSIHFMNNSSRRASRDYTKFRKQINYFKKWISKKQLDIEDYCISSSSVLSAYGLREGNDLDYLHNSEEITGHKMIQSHNNYGKSIYHTHIHDIIYNPENHFYFNNIKFASLDVVKKLKQKRMEKKDVNDVKLIDKVYGSTEKTLYSNFILYKVCHMITQNMLNTDKECDKIYYVKGYRASDEDYEKSIRILNERKLDYIEECKLNSYNDLLQKQKYHAPTFLYHSHLNQNKIIKDKNYIGLIEYDIDLALDRNESLHYNDITIDNYNFNLYNEITRIINLSKDHDFILFLSVKHKLASLSKQDHIRINSIHWLDYFITDYNKRFKTTYSKKSILKKFGNQMIGTQQSFLCSKSIFLKISKYVYEFINDNIHSKYEPMPCTILERYIAMFLLLEDCNKFYIPLKHDAVGYRSNYKYDT